MSKAILYKIKLGLGCGLMVECLHNTDQHLSSNPSTTKKQNQMWPENGVGKWKTANRKEKENILIAHVIIRGKASTKNIYRILFNVRNLAGWLRCRVTVSLSLNLISGSKRRPTLRNWRRKPRILKVSSEDADAGSKHKSWLLAHLYWRLGLENSRLCQSGQAGLRQACLSCDSLWRNDHSSVMTQP